MKKPLFYPVLLAILASQTVSASASVYSFGGNCPSQGAWTQMALAQSQQIASAVQQLKNNPACKGIDSVVQNLNSATAVLQSPKDSQNREDRIESLPTEIDVLRKSVMEGGQINQNSSSMLLHKTIEAAGLSSQMPNNDSRGGTQSVIAKATQGLTKLFTTYAAPTQKGLQLISGVLQTLPQYDECLIGQPRQGLAIIGGAVKVAAAFSAAGEGVGNELGNALANITTMMRDRRFTAALRKVDENEFWFSMSCMMEGAAKNYCDAQNAQEILRYTQAQYQEAAKKNLKDRNNAGYDNPLEGYYLLVRELPVISAWLQQVQFGVSPKLASEASFKNKIWDQVTDLTKTVNSLNGYFNEQMLFMRELKDVPSKRNHLFNNILTPLINTMGGSGDSASSAQFFTTTVNPTLLPFYLIGRESVPEECRVTPAHSVPQTFDLWMKTGGVDGGFIKEFNDPEKLATTIQSRMNDIIAGASQKSSAYFRQRLVVDMPNLVNGTLTGQYMTVRKAFENVYNYLNRFEAKLKANADNPDANIDLAIIPSVRETKIKIKRFLRSYDKLRELGKKMIGTDDDTNPLMGQVNDAAREVIDTVFTEFNILFLKDTFLTTRLNTFIEKDFSMRIHTGLNMTGYQQDLLTITQKHLIDKLTEVHGLNPTNAQIDLARAQMINKRNLEVMEQTFGDTFYRVILQMKTVVAGAGTSGMQKALDEKFRQERSTVRSVAFMLPGYMGGGMFAWLFAGSAVRSAHPDLYTTENARNITGKDDKFGSVGQMQAMFCAQTLAFEGRERFADVCQGTVLKSYYSGLDVKALNGSSLDLRYDDYVAPGAASSYVKGKLVPGAKGRSRFDAGKNICAYNDFTIHNLVQWLKDQDKEMYSESVGL